jgi:hypothetical protein
VFQLLLVLAEWLAPRPHRQEQVGNQVLALSLHWVVVQVVHSQPPVLMELPEAEPDRQKGAVPRSQEVRPATQRMDCQLRTAKRVALRPSVKVEAVAAERLSRELRQPYLAVALAERVTHLV